MVKISPKYQVVIPEEVRQALGFKPGMLVDVIAKGNIAYIVPRTSIEDLQKKLKGKIDSKELRDKKDRTV